jgi:hypothetical protein
LYVARKSQSGSNPTPKDFNIAVERAFVSWVMDQYGNPHKYQPGRPIPNIQWQVTQNITDNLRFLLERRNFTVGSDGKFTIPDGTFNSLEGSVAPKYLHVSSIRSPYTTQKNGALKSVDTPVTILKDHEIGERIFSEIDSPTLKYPVCGFYDSFVQFYPKNIGRVTFTYLRIPTPPKWAFTTVNNRPVYDAANSVDIESPDITHNEIAMRTLSYLGISIREQQLVQYAEQLKNDS